MSHKLDNTYFSSVTILLTKEFKQALLTATNDRDSYSFIVFDLRMNNNENRLFYVDESQIDSLHNSLESILSSNSVSVQSSKIPWSSQYSPMYLSSAIAEILGINMGDYFSTPACRIEYSNNSSDPTLFVIMFGKKAEWTYQSPIINLFVSFIDYVNKKKDSLSLERLHTFDIDRTISEACDYTSIIRAACERELIYRFTGKPIKQQLKSISYFDLVCNLACMTYEGALNTGYIRFTAEPISMQSTICFQTPLACTIENRRELRKLLEMTDSNTGILVTKGNVVGLTKGKQYRSFIQFSGSGKWKLYLNDTTQPIVSVEGNVCRFCLNKDPNVFYPVFQSVFGDNGKPDTINAIVEAAKLQKHGTSIIISEYAEEESRRLAEYSRAIQIIPIDFDDNLTDAGLIKSLTSIDGALILSLTGKCFAIGAILDGEACSPGSTARGARYNSLANYVKWKLKGTPKHPSGIRSMAVVISEDKTIDFISPYEYD